MIKLTVQGDAYEFDGDRLLLAEARELKKFTGFSPGRWNAGLEDGDPDAVAFLIYLAKKRAGESLRYSDLDTIDYADIEMEQVGEDEAEDQDDGQAQTADPTPLPSESGTTRTDGTGAISPPSPTTSSTPPATSAP